MVLTHYGRPIAILMEVSEENLETYLTPLRESRALEAKSWRKRPCST